MMKKKPKKGALNTKPVTKTEQCDSFFNFFNPPQVPEDDDIDQETVAPLIFYYFPFLPNAFHVQWFIHLIHLHEMFSFHFHLVILSMRGRLGISRAQGNACYDSF